MMRRITYNVLLCSFLFAACSGGDEDVNIAPSAPKLIYPTNNQLCIDNTIDFKWNPSNDPDSNIVTYQIEITKDDQFNQIDHQVQASSTNTMLTLEKETAYYWRVMATDEMKASSDYSSVFRLYTEGVGISNHLPFTPELVKPLLGAIESEGTFSLEWTANDTDNDLLSFDVYFGTSNPPSIVATNLITNILSVDIVSSQQYYWRVVVKDGNGGETIGQIWNFSVE